MLSFLLEFGFEQCDSLLALEFEFLDLRQAFLVEVADAALELSGVLVAVEFEFLQDLFVELLEMIRFLLVLGFEFLEVCFGRLLERLDFLGLLLLELADLTMQLGSLLVVLKLELLQNVFVELLQVRDSFQSVGLGFVHVRVEFRFEFIQVFFQFFDFFVFFQ